MEKMDNKRMKRKGENPKRFIPDTEPSTRTCKNPACRAVLSVYDTFCRRCSCCICHSYDDNKDPTLWLECSPSSPAVSCGLSCHIECALEHGKAGVINAHMTQLDGYYRCASCDQVSEILGCWKKQLTVAKDCQRVEILCYRILLSFMLLDGTRRFHDLHKIVKEAKDKLETEVGPLGRASAQQARAIVSGLRIAVVQALCLSAIRKAEDTDEGAGQLELNFERFVSVIRGLECENLIAPEFRLKLFTWFSFRATERERKAVRAYIHEFMDDPSSLADQLMDSFGHILHE